MGTLTAGGISVTVRSRGAPGGGKGGAVAGGGAAPAQPTTKGKSAKKAFGNPLECTREMRE